MIEGNTTFSYKGKEINRVFGIKWLIDSYKDNLESRVQLGETPLYSPTGVLNRELADSLAQEVKTMMAAVRNLRTSEDITGYILSNISRISGMLGSIGVDVDMDNLSLVLTDYQKNSELVTDTTNMSSLLGNLNSIYSNFNNKKNNEYIIDTPEDILRVNTGAYENISLPFSKLHQQFVEDSVHELGKGYWSYRQSSLLARMIKSFNAKMGGFERFQEFMHEQFDQYGETYYNAETDEYYNEWLNLLSGKSLEFKTSDVGIQAKTNLDSGEITREEYNKIM